MTTVRSVCDLGMEIETARIKFTDPRNFSTQWLAVDDYARGTGTDEALPAEVWLDRGKQADAVGADGSGPGFFVSSRLRELLAEVAPDDFDVHPREVIVGGRPMWFLRFTTVLDALDLDASDVTIDPNGQIGFLNHAVWKSTVLIRPMIFRIPQLRGRTWLTDRVAAAYLASGYSGFLVGGPDGDIQ